MIATLLYALGFAGLCYEAAKHGAFGLLITSLWVWAVFLYAFLGAAIVRAINRGDRRAPNPLPREASQLVKSAREADARARAEGGGK